MNFKVRELIFELAMWSNSVARLQEMVDDKFSMFLSFGFPGAGLMKKKGTLKPT